MIKGIQPKQAKYLVMTQKSGCVSADYSMIDADEEGTLVLTDETQKSGYFREDNNVY